MSRRKNEIKRKAFPFIIAGAIIATFLIICSFFYIKPNDTGQTIISQNEGVSDNQIASNKYTLGNLTINLPSGWSEVKEKDESAEEGVGFVHSASNSALYIDKYSYMPEVNMLLFQSDASSFLPSGTVLTDYNTNGQNESTIYYEAQSNAGTYYCGKKYIWDKDEIYVITANINSVYYDRLAESMDYILNTASFNGINPIDKDIYLNFDSTFRCQYGMPLGWVEKNGIFVKDENTLSTTVLNKPVDFKISDYNTMEFQKDFPASDIIYTSLREEDGYMVAEGTVNAGGGKSTIYIAPLSVNDNNYIVGFVWKYTDEGVKEIAEKCIKEFKVYSVDKENTESSTTNEPSETTKNNKEKGTSPNP